MPELCTGKLVRTVPRGVALSNGRCLLYPLAAIKRDYQTDLKTHESCKSVIYNVYYL